MIASLSFDFSICPTVTGLSLPFSPFPFRRHHHAPFSRQVSQLVTAPLATVSVLLHCPRASCAPVLRVRCPSFLQSAPTPRNTPAFPSSSRQRCCRVTRQSYFRTGHSEEWQRRTHKVSRLVSFELRPSEVFVVSLRPNWTIFFSKKCNSVPRAPGGLSLSFNPPFFLFFRQVSSCPSNIVLAHDT